MQWNRRSTTAFAAAALLTGAGVAFVASSTASTQPAGSDSSSHADPTSGTPTVLDDSTGRSASARHGADDVGFEDDLVVSTEDPATHDVGDDNGVDDPATHDVGDDNGVDDPATHDVGDDNGSSGSRSDDSGSGGHGADD